MFLGWSMFVTWGAFEHAAYVADMLGAREKEVATGKFGQVATFPDSLKFFVLLMVRALAVWISGYALGSNVDELIDFFNHYEDKFDQNADVKDDPGATYPYYLSF